MMSPSELIHLLIFGLGPTELIVILAILFLLFGASKIPQLARGLGKGITEFKQGLKEQGDEPDKPDEIEEDTGNKKD
jgi:sec-independent protein translocase protein TatA